MRDAHNMLLKLTPVFNFCFSANFLFHKCTNLQYKLKKAASIYLKDALKMLANLTPGLNFINILRAAFALVGLRQ